jgi:hypothetical protein
VLSDEVMAKSARLITLRRELAAHLTAASQQMTGAPFAASVMAAGGGLRPPAATIPAASGAAGSVDTALGVFGAIVGGVMGAIQDATRELEALKADLVAHPEIDSSASAAEAAATAADMPD